MLHKNVLEHVATDRVDILPLTIRIHDVDHPGLLLVAFGPLAIEVVHVQSDSGTQR